MGLVSLKQIFIGLLMIFNQHTSVTNVTAAPRGSRCISEQTAARRVSRFMAHWKMTSVYGVKNHNCTQQAGKPVACRSLSPWKIRIEKEDGRIPHEISRAECISKGCFINQQENFSYNSVLVFAEVIVLRKSPCRSNPTKHSITKHVVSVPVACTCVVPNYAQ